MRGILRRNNYIYVLRIFMHINPSEGVSVNIHAGVSFPKGEDAVCYIDNVKVEVVFYGELWLK